MTGAKRLRTKKCAVALNIEIAAFVSVLPSAYVGLPTAAAALPWFQLAWILTHYGGKREWYLCNKAVVDTIHRFVRLTLS